MNFVRGKKDDARKLRPAVGVKCGEKIQECRRVTGLVRNFVEL